MRSPAVLMLSIASLAAAGALAAAPASAKEVSDAAYLQAARCAGLAQGSALDTSKVDAFLKSEQVGRMSYVLDRADEMRSDGVRAAKHAGAYGKQAITDQISGACQAYLGHEAQGAQVAVSR